MKMLRLRCFDGFALDFESKTTGVFPACLGARPDFRTVNFPIFDGVIVGTVFETRFFDVCIQMMKITDSFELDCKNSRWPRARACLTLKSQNLCSKSDLCSQIAIHAKLIRTVTILKVGIPT